MEKHSWKISVIIIFIFANWASAQRDVFYETKMLAQWGKTTSQYELGLMYYKGQGVDQNYGEALKWFRLAARKGFDKAQYYLGLMYFEGRGVSPNFEVALYLFSKAANQGHAGAQFSLGEMYISGKGANKNFVAAYAWTSLAFDNGYDQAKQNLKLLSKEMTPFELEKAVTEAEKLRDSILK